MSKEFKFNVISVHGLTTYAVQIPDTIDGIALLDEVGRALSHRGEYDLAKRIANVVSQRKQELRSQSTQTEPGTESQQAVQSLKQINPATCVHCGQLKSSVSHHPDRQGGHVFKPQAPSRTTRRIPKIVATPGDSL